MEEALLMAKAKDTKERMAGVEWLHELLEASRKSLSSSEVTALIDCCMDLLKDNNFRVSQGALQVLSSAVVLSGEYFKLHFNGLVPAVVEKLGDGKQPVRDAARQLLVTLMEVSSPTIIVERAGSYAWSHKRWRVREEFARTVSAAVGLFASTELPLQRVLLPPVLQLLNDPNQSVKDAATSCIEEMYSQAGSQFRDELQRYHLPLPMMKEINSRLELIEPKVKSSYARESPFNHTEMKSTSHTKKRTSPKVKITRQEISPAAGENDVTEKNIDPIIVYSEKELFREFEKIASNLVPEKDWSVRIAAMQRIEGLVFGGAMDYPSFLTILKQLVSPLSSQLSDRRSSIVKQACHLLNLLSKELLGDFETCAEMFIPVLFKLVVITVLVIAESADNCIKTMLRNCKVSRVLSRIAVCAKNDRSAVLRARCCEYALLILEYWADAPEIQRSADLYEDLIKCCVADAMSEVRSTARTCYRMFSKTWPERSRRLFLSFDPVIQRIINDEDGGMHKRYTSPSLRERGVQFSRAPFQSATSISGFGTSAIVAMDRSATISSGTSLSANNLCMSQTKTPGEGSVRNIESVLHVSKQKVTAIESLLKGVNLSEGTNSLTTVPNLGVNYPSSRNQLFTPALTQHVSRNASLIDSVSTNITRNSSESLYPSNMTSNSLPSLSSRLMVRRSADRVHDNGSFDANDSHGSHVPNFQRPLLRKQATSRNANSRKSFDDSQFFSSQITGSYMDGPTSLNDALMEGLSPNSDWVARVSAFNYLRALLQQGPKSIQEVMQSFEKVMKLFLQHLDDRHHKVAQAALSTLAEIIPACRKPFESYLERTLPHVFSHLIDPKELVRKPCSATLEIVSRTYGIESLLPALLRSLDEQRSPKAKLAVIEFANNSFNKHGTNSEGPGNSGYLKLWLSKLLPLINEKNTKLKESAIAGYISVYSHFDSVAVLNFIIGLSVETQNALRRALKQFTPRIEVDLMSFLQNKKERQQRQRLSYDQSDVGTSSEEGYVGSSKKSMFFGRYSAGAHDNDSSGKWNFVQEISNFSGSVEQDVFDENQEHYNPNYSVNPDNEILLNSKVNNFKYNAGISMDTNALSNFSEKTDLEIEFQSSVGNPKPNNDVLQHDGQRNIGVSVVDETLQNIQHEKKTIQKNESSIPQLLHQICFDGNSSEIKHEALYCLMEASKSNDHSMWTKYFSQILTAMLKVLDDPDPSIRELVLSLIVEMMKNDNVKDSIEMVLEKLLHSTKDVVAKVTNETHHCLNILLSECDPHRCLTVVEPLLLCEDEKMLVTSVNCLTKLVTRLSQVELMTELPSFLPALFDAFGNPSVDVRKSVVFCLVDIYIMLDQEFLPYLEGLNSTQLQLVTLYANRISQARSDSEIDSSNHH